VDCEYLSLESKGTCHQFITDRKINNIHESIDRSTCSLYYAEVPLGNPNETFQVVLDTGSNHL
jgi:hypothetical protein